MARAARRMGLTGGKAAATGLLALACIGGAAGVAVQSQTTGFTVEQHAAEGAEGDAATTAANADGLAPAEDEATAKETYVVHVDGAVAMPGVVTLTGDDVRVADAVEAAGGLTEQADTSTVNLAEPLVDGSKVHIPTTEELADAAYQAPSSAQSAGTGAPTQTGSGGVGLININTASVEELQQLKGVGEVTAQTIVEDRERNGPFASPEDVMRVSGIGEKKFENMRESICV